MKKYKILFVAAALAAVSLSSACTLIYDSESSDISSDSDEISFNSSQGESNSSGQSFVEKVPVEFSEEDREVQKILSDMMEPANKVYGWIENTNAFGNSAYRFRFPDRDKTEIYVYYLFSVSGSSNNSSLKKPNTYSDLKELILEYFSADKTETLLMPLSVCSAVENADGTYTVKSTDGSPIINHPFFIEADGKLYQYDVRGDGSIPIALNTVKVSSKTDDTIKFTYIDGSRKSKVDIPTCLGDITFYSKNAVNGTLKYERGGWKLDSWDVIID